MHFEILNNSLNLYNKNTLIIENITCYFKNNNQTIYECDKYWSLVYRDEKKQIVKSLNCEIILMKETNGCKIQVKLKNIKNDFFNGLEFCAFKGIYHNYINKALINHFVYANNNMVNEMQSTLETITLLSNKTVLSADNISFIDEKDKNCIFGFITYKNYFNNIFLSYDGSLKAIHLLENHPFLKDETLISDWIYLGFFNDINYHGLPKFAKIVAKNMQAKLKIKRPAVGYCTWYYYYSTIKEKNIYDNLKELKNHPEFPIKYFQIDDGWQKYWGQWEVDENKFPNFKKLIFEIKSQGYKPGIWLAPFGASEESEVYKNHPDWFVKNWENDNLYGIPSLDFSNPMVKKYIYEVFYKLSHEYGFKYFKLDIITSRIAPGRYFDPSFNAIRNLREGFKIIRKAIGDDCEILACTCPLAPVVGLCDYMRVSGDVFGNWDSLVYIFNSTLKRYYLNNNFYIIDADCLLVRKKENEDEEAQLHCSLSNQEIKTYISLIACSGGNIMLSDKLKNLSKEQFSLIDKIFPNINNSAIPMDLMDSHLIFKLDCGKINNLRVIVLVNWEEKPKHFKLDISNCHVFDFWSENYEGIFKKEYKCILNPHCCKVLHIYPVEKISVIATNATIRPKIIQKYENNILCGQFIKKNETQYIYSKYILEEKDNLIKVKDNLYKIINNNSAKDYQIKIKNKKAI